MIKFVGDLPQVGTPVASTNKTDHHDITEILLKVALNTKNQNQTKPKSNGFRLYDFLTNKTAMRLDKKLSQLMDCHLPTNNTHIIMTTNLAHTQI